MPLGFWIFLAVPVYVWLWRMSFRGYVFYCRDPDTDEIDSVAVVLTAVVATLFCWLLAPVLILRETACAVDRRVDWADVARALGGETRAQKAERRERELRERELRVAEIERNIGV